MRPEYDRSDSWYDSAPPAQRPPRLWPGLTSLVLGLVGVGFEVVAVIVGLVWNDQVRAMQQGQAMVATLGAVIGVIILLAVGGKVGLIAGGFGIGAIFSSRGRGRRLGIYGLVLGVLAALPALILVTVLKVGEHAHW